jgi:type II secretory pathway component PulM
MRAQLRKLWESRSPSDRLVILILAAVVGAMLYLWMVQAAAGARARLGSSVAALREQAARLDRNVSELGRVRAQRVPPPPTTDLRTQVQARRPLPDLRERCCALMPPMRTR